MASGISLAKRPLPELTDQQLALFDNYSAKISGTDLPEDTKEVILKMLGHSSPFVSFLEYIEANGQDKEAARIIPVDKDFQASFRKELVDTGFTWTESLDLGRPHILRDSIGRDVRLTGVFGGWHAVLTPINEADGFLMAGAKVKGRGLLQSDQIDRLIRNSFPQIKGAYANERKRSNRLETEIGLRRGRVHIFLADDVMDKFAGIALHNNYLEDADPGDLIMFTMHAKFFFICSVRDLQSWLKSTEARFAFKDKLRIHTHLYEATAADLDQLQDTDVQAVLKGVREKLDMVKNGKIPPAKAANAIAGSIQSQLKETGLNWRTEDALILIKNDPRFATISSEL